SPVFGRTASKPTSLVGNVQPRDLGDQRELIIEPTEQLLGDFRQGAGETVAECLQSVLRVEDARDEGVFRLVWPHEDPFIEGMIAKHHVVAGDQVIAGDEYALEEGDVLPRVIQKMRL